MNFFYYLVVKVVMLGLFKVFVFEGKDKNVYVNVVVLFFVSRMIG